MITVPFNKNWHTNGLTLSPYNFSHAIHLHCPDNKGHRWLPDLWKKAVLFAQKLYIQSSLIGAPNTESVLKQFAGEGLT